MLRLGAFRLVTAITVQCVWILCAAIGMGFITNALAQEVAPRHVAEPLGGTGDQPGDSSGQARPGAVDEELGGNEDTQGYMVERFRGVPLRRSSSPLPSNDLPPTERRSAGQNEDEAANEETTGFIWSEPTGREQDN